MAPHFQPAFVFPGTVYRVVRHLATGGMGSLYEVEDETVGRKYVLKTLHPEMVERADLAIRMREEARALGRLQHPNIVQVITAGVTMGVQPMPFYVMERLVGENLRTVLDSRKVDGGIGLRHALRITIDMLGALQHAHDHQLVHRDVKPENIFLHRGASATELKLLDFGIVRLLNREASLTRGKFIGTLKYASPEQVTGLVAIGPASDVYSLALVLYEMIRLRGPFDDAPDHVKIGLMHAQEIPSALSNHVRHLPPEIDAVVTQALSKMPAERPLPAAFAAVLRAVLRRLDETPDSRTEVELLSMRHPNDARAVQTTHALGREQPTMTSAELAPTMDEGAPLLGTTRIEETVAAEPPTPPMGPPVDGGVTAVIVGGAYAHGPPPVLGHAALDAPLPRVIDRNAPTRVPMPNVAALRVPSNDTVVEAPAPAPGERIATVHMGQLGRPMLASPRPAAVPQAYISTVHTRPRKQERRPIFVVGIAAAVAVMMIAGAAVAVRRPWAGHGTSVTVVPSK